MPANKKSAPLFTLNNVLGQALSGKQVGKKLTPVVAINHFWFSWAAFKPETRSLIKLVADSSTGKLLGAHILAPEAGEVIQVASMAIHFGITINQLREMMFPFLTNMEGLKLAILAFDKDLAKLSCCAD